MQGFFSKFISPFLTLVFFVVFSPLTQGEEVSAELLLAKMAKASRNLSYSGTFTYEDGQGATEALEVTHKVIAGVETEVVRHLTGPDRSFKLPKRDAGCASVGAGLLMSVGKTAFRDHPNYFYAVRGTNRIADREVHILRVIPKDEYRYGLTLGLDKETGLALFAAVMSPKKLLERVQFTSLNILEEGGSEIDVAAEVSGNCALGSSGNSPLEPQWVPDGFTLAGYSYLPETGHVQTYTDGLASFSLTVKALPGTVGQSLQGEAQRGATVIKLVRVALNNLPVQISVIGEIPPVSATRVLRSVRPSGLPSGLPSGRPGGQG